MRRDLPGSFQAVPPREVVELYGQQGCGEPEERSNLSTLSNHERVNRKQRTLHMSRGLFFLNSS